jgi:hypothetical protein
MKTHTKVKLKRLIENMVRNEVRKQKRLNESKKLWIGWFVLTHNIRGDLNYWKKGELIKAEKSDESGYIFIQTADVTTEAYDDIESSVFKRSTEPFSSDRHKKHLNYLEKLKAAGEIKSWESY